jgi:multicomponent K+:H+ antiporter subunit D
MFGADAGPSAGFAREWILYTGLATLTFATVGMLASQNLSRLAGFSTILSSGTLLAAIGFGEVRVTAGALYYLVSSTLAIASFFLLLELIERSRNFGADLLALTREAFGIGLPADVEEETGSVAVGVAIPAAMAFLGLSFVACALLLTGLPPLSGFIAKFVVLTSVLNPDGLTPEIGNGVGAVAWVMVALLIVSGLTGAISLTRVGIRTFWAPSGRAVPRLRVIEVFPIATWLVLCLALTVQAGPAMRYMDATANALHHPQDYIRSVLSARQIPQPSMEQEP